MLTLESFEEASEIVKKVTQETKLIKSSYFSDLTGNLSLIHILPIRWLPGEPLQRSMQFTGWLSMPLESQSQPLSVRILVQGKCAECERAWVYACLLYTSRCV